MDVNVGSSAGAAGAGSAWSWILVVAQLLMAAAALAAAAGLWRFGRGRGDEASRGVLQPSLALLLLLALALVTDLLSPALPTLQVLLQLLLALVTLGAALRLWRALPAAMARPTEGAQQSRVDALEARAVEQDLAYTQARERARLDQARLDQAQQRFQRVVEAAPNGLLLVNQQGRITLANRKAEELFGSAAGALQGLSVDDLVPKPWRAAHAGQMAGMFADRKPRPMGPGRDVTAQRLDGTEVPVEIGLSLLEMPDGPHTLASIIDISGRKKRDDELRRSNADLEQFAYIASHDLQEPLRMVASYTELLGQRYRGQLDERADKYIFYAVDGAKRMQRLVADLLAFSRVGSQGKPLLPVAMGPVLDDVLRVLDAPLRDSGGRVQADALPTVLADEGQLHQLLLNLLGNALKFRSEAAPQIRISAAREHDFWAITVSDNGIGIELQYRERIFQMFQRLHERGRYEGSGIGLAIAKRIVERHGGSITLDSEPGVGSSFRFSLPAVPAQEESAASIAAGGG